ncbi:ATP synthase F0 subunit C [Limisalsivibrio acetivorans]|uniref:ATP synthase F0 subunit C n=1 Tax=Limisalsivibrio acetivorans TaxID=1304888 RepID=UPI0003B6138D|nr:ATP synthase F0 subunit C [Limisalsivibrio acetivorans]
MSKAVRIVLNVVAVMALFSVSAFAAENGGETYKWAHYIAAGFGMGIAAFGTGMGQGKAISSAVEGISRNPSASGKISTTMIIGLALIESLAIYALVVALILLFVV